MGATVFPMNITFPTLLIALGTAALAAGCGYLAVMCGQSFMEGISMENLPRFAAHSAGLPGGTVLAVVFAKLSLSALRA